MSDANDPSPPPPAIPVDLPRAAPADSPQADPVELRAVSVPGTSPPALAGQAVQTLTYSNRPVTYGIWHQRRRLVLSKQTSLPPRCVKCNQHTDRRFKRKMTWHHPAWFLLLLLGLPGLLILVIVALATRKKAIVKVGLCAKHRSQRRWVIAASWLIVLSSIALWVLAVNYESFAYFGIGILFFLLGLFVYILFGQVVTAARIDNHYVWLNGVSRAYRESFPPWPW